MAAALILNRTPQKEQLDHKIRNLTSGSSFSDGRIDLNRFFSALMANVALTRLLALDLPT
jgi:hypothetical protein